jgi:hypothetical protein
MDWIDLAEDRDQWRALVTFGFREMLGSSLSGCTTGSFMSDVLICYAGRTRSRNATVY